MSLDSKFTQSQVAPDQTPAREDQIDPRCWEVLSPLLSIVVGRLIRQQTKRRQAQQASEGDTVVLGSRETWHGHDMRRQFEP